MRYACYGGTHWGSEAKQGRAHQLPLGYRYCMVYTTLMAGSKHVSIVVRNMTDNAIFPKKGVRVAHVVSAMLAPSEEAPSEQDEDAQALKEI